MTAVFNAAQVWAESLTDRALAVHLRRLNENIGYFGKSQRAALLVEAADRFDGIRKCPGCGTKTALKALSRFDGRTLVCSSCGVNEGRAVVSGSKLTAPGKVEWVNA